MFANTPNPSARSLSNASSTARRWMRYTAAIAVIALGAAPIPGTAGPAPAETSKPADSPRLLNDYGKLPLHFEANRGQTDKDVNFISRGPGYTLFLTPKEAVFSLRSDSHKAAAAGKENAFDAPRRAGSAQPQQNAVLRVQLIDPNLEAAITGADQLPGKANYIHGNDPAKWSTDVPTFAKVKYSSVFPGIDLVYYGNSRQLEYDFVVAAGADAQRIGLTFSGARNLHVDSLTGDLAMTVGKQELRFHKPVAYQNQLAQGSQSAQRNLVAASYSIDAQNRVNFSLGAYDHSQPLVIDPTLAYSTYLGGAASDNATQIAVDNAGNAYITGYTNSANFPTTSGVFQPACSGGCSGTTVDAFVSKLDPTGSVLLFSTYIGGTNNDYSNGIVLDAAGNIYIAGQTYSTNYPVTPGVLQSRCSNTNCTGADGFITKLNPQGSALLYSTYLGGSGIDQINGIALDSANNAYVTGYTQSTSFPTTVGAYQRTCNCTKGSDAFISKINPTGTALVYSSFLGGSSAEVGYAVALDPAGNAYLTGYTHSTDFPTTPGAFQTSLFANTAAFVTKMNTTGSALAYSSYLGGSTSITTTPCETCAVDIAVDSAGSAYVSGLTAESTFPLTANAFQKTFKSATNGHDAFITKFTPDGTGLSFSTYYGGSGDDGATGIVVDAAGNVWFKGNTKSLDLPLTAGTYQTTSGGGFDAYIAELDPTGSTLLYATYLGGTGDEFGAATRMITVDNQNPPNVYVTGYTNSTNFPITGGALQSSLAGNNDVFVSKFVPSPNLGLSAGLSFGYQNDGTTSAPQTVTLTNAGNANLNVSSITVTGPNNQDFSQTNNCTAVLPQSTCTVTVTFTPSITGNESASLSIADDAAHSPQSVSLTGIGIGSGPAASLSPTSLTFATQLIGTQSPSQAVTLSNIGNSTLTISRIAVTGDFSQVNNCGVSVAAGASCVITVTFAPKAPNSRTGAITITDNAVGSPQTVSLTGTGTFVTLSPPMLNFGSVTVGTSSAPQSSTFTNTAKFALPIKNLLITGANPLDFSQTNTCGASVAAGASCTITVTFRPTAIGPRTAAVSVADGGGGSPQLVSLTGTGK